MGSFLRDYVGSALAQLGSDCTADRQWEGSVATWSASSLSPNCLTNPILKSKICPCLVVQPLIQTGPLKAWA